MSEEHLAEPVDDGGHDAVGEDRRTVVVTGGTSGIGAAVAERFAAAGARVIAAGLDTAGAAGRLPESVRRVEIDLTHARDLEDFIGGVERLDVLVNAAGVIARGHEYEPEVFAHVVDVNLTGTMRACVASHDLLRRSGGCIVNVASMLSFFGGPRVPAYTASKGGITQLTKALADATGAGDTFDGAFAARLLDGDSPLEAARYAVIAAALTTTGHGAVGPIPTADAVRQAGAA
ncbi:SDR family NAD(P)-dependent oxidoreductase [Streptomyces niveus]|uniref:SDR family NAD(P)-dependent oxidoreductase n=1 Tax=Streptomyces niveus TaxID=193462 RepID=UPI00364E77D0